MLVGSIFTTALAALLALQLDRPELADAHARPRALAGGVLS
jgi:hypothetical protein